jgi:hypothetical protein
MDNTTDHDLLIKLNTNVESIIEQQKNFINRYETRHTDLVTRVSILERKDSGDSEKFRAITEEIRRSLNNAQKIDQLTIDVNVMGDKMRTMEKKSNILDAINALGAVLATIIAYILGKN